MNLFTRFFNQQPIGQIDAVGLKARQNQVFLLDVRQPEEFRQGHISGAKLIPLDQLQQRIHDLPRDREIVCICHSGNRSRQATRLLAQSGYQATNLQGGMISWTGSGLPVKKG
jgi:rhodanese-related sulfurtransferase